MNVSSIFGSSSASDVSAVSQVSSSSASQASSSSSDVQGDTTQVSGPAQFLQKLQALEESDPAKAKEVLTSIADKLKTAASSATGDQATQLSALAGKFQTAADTGDLSGLQPPEQAASSAGHHHGGHGHRAYAQQSQQQSSDDATSTLMAVADSAMS